MPVSEKDYCTKTCKAKCCIHPIDKVPCPQLAADFSCKIYEKRYGGENPPDVALVGFYEHDGKRKPFFCGKMKQLVAQGKIALPILEQCCIAHPERLLTDDDEAQ